MKAIFKITWSNGTPQIPEDIQVDGISAMENITGSGNIKAMIEAPEDIIELLKDSLEFIDYIDYID